MHTNSHIRYAVKTPEGYMGHRRYSYSKGTSGANQGAAFKAARLYARKQDAVAAAGEKDKVIPVVVTEIP